jgi:hypothetical protein
MSDILVQKCGTWRGAPNLFTDDKLVYPSYVNLFQEYKLSRILDSCN